MRNFVGIEGGTSLVASALAIALSLLGCGSGSNTGSGNTSGGATSTATAAQGGTSGGSGGASSNPGAGAVAGATVVGGGAGAAGSGGAAGSVGFGGSGGIAGSAGSGGFSASGGSGTATSTAVTGGAGNMGGTVRTGGATAIGGATPTGGTTRAGGTPASGGTRATGGATPTGGTTRTGGTTPTGGGGSGGVARGSGGSAVDGGGGGGGATVGTIDLCAGMVTDKDPHPMTALAKPALGGTVIDAEFGTTIRRITAVAGSGANAAIVPMYTTISAWNADESLLILYSVGGGGHQLYDGKTYQHLRSLDINPADLEQVYWDTSDPDILYYVDNQEFIRYHVSAGTQDKLHSFSTLCGSSSVSNGDDPMFTSWDSHRLGLVCGNQMFIYDSATDSVLGPKAVSGTPPAQVAPSGTLAYLEAGSGQVLDANLNLVRSLGLQVPDNHASLGQLANGHDTWNGAVYDDGNDDASSNVGILVTWDMTDGTGGAVIGPKTGWPYPPDGHISAMAYKQPGWIFVSTIPDDTAGLQGKTLLGLENLIADTNTGKVCRVGRHRSWGKNNSVLGYWAEAHTVPSPSGTRAVFGSDWGNGTSVDSYVLELPSYSP
jgi:hypothetical protein